MRASYGLRPDDIHAEKDPEEDRAGGQFSLRLFGSLCSRFFDESSPFYLIGWIGAGVVTEPVLADTVALRNPVRMIKTIGESSLIFVRPL